MCPTTCSNNSLNRSLLWSLYREIMPVNYFSNGQFNAFSFSCIGHVQYNLQICDMFSRIVSREKKNHRKGKTSSKHTKVKLLPDLTTLTSRLPHNRQIMMPHSTPHSCFRFISTWMDHSPSRPLVMLRGKWIQLEQRAGDGGPEPPGSTGHMYTEVGWGRGNGEVVKANRRHTQEFGTCTIFIRTFTGIVWKLDCPNV